PTRREAGHRLTAPLPHAPRSRRPPTPLGHARAPSQAPVGDTARETAVQWARYLTFLSANHTRILRVFVLLDHGRDRTKHDRVLHVHSFGTVSVIRDLGIQGLSHADKRRQNRPVTSRCAVVVAQGTHGHASVGNAGAR